MTNSYFNHVNNRIDPGSRALDSQVNNIADEVALGFDRLPTEAELKENTTNFALSTGTPNALIVALTYTPSLLNGFNLYIQFNATSTGAATLNVSATGAKSVVNSDGSPLTGGAMVIDTIGQFAYDLPNDRYILISNNSAWGKPVVSASTSPSEYCPGYTFTFVDEDEWRITGLDVTNLFNAGRRLKFIDGQNTYFGSITLSVFTGGNTDITMDMEGIDVLTSTINEVCLVTGTAGWSPIATDPFAGGAINDICIGDISSVTYLFAVGDVGRCGVSSDGGLNWVMLSTGTTENLKVCAYDSSNEQFWGGGDAGVLVNTDNATSITLDTTSIPALTGTTSDNISGFVYKSTEDALGILFDITATSHRLGNSLNQGGSWQEAGTTLHPPENCKGLRSRPDGAGGTGLSLSTIRAGHFQELRWDSGVTDSSLTGGFSTNDDISVIIRFEDNGTIPEIFAGFSGNVDGLQFWGADDTVTFGNIHRDFAWSPIHERLILVGDNAQLGYLDKADRALTDAWTNTGNGFNPLANIYGVVWDSTHGVFVAVADNGQICRSTNGIN